MHGYVPALWLVVRGFGALLKFIQSLSDYLRRALFAIDALNTQSILF
jgi:hypothetical protein